MLGSELGRLDAPTRAAHGADQGERVRRPVGGPAHALRTGEAPGPGELTADDAAAVVDHEEAVDLPAVVLPEQREPEPPADAAPATGTAATAEGSGQRTS